MTQSPPSPAAERPPLKVLLAAPRGFCAGVDRAILMVERALQKYGAPVYVRHEIVHNKTVVCDLEAKGAVFVAELDQIPDGAVVLFSAHGVPKAIPQEATRRGLQWLDATCPLVSKVHREAEHHHRQGRLILLIGHAGHPEVVGTMGQLPEGAVILIEDEADVAALTPPRDVPLAFVTQTTLSVDDTAHLVARLSERFPDIVGPKTEDICYATTNRQSAVKRIASQVEHMLVVGAPNSSNSKRLVEVAHRYGCPGGTLVQGPEDLPWPALHGVQRLGLSSGASAPESQVQAILAALREHYTVQTETVTVTTEDQVFKVPASLAV